MAEQDNNNRRKPRRQQPLDNTYGHLQPQALDVERAVLGALMIDKDAYAVVCETLYPQSFYEPRNQMIYTAIRDLAMAEKPVDVLTVTDRRPSTCSPSQTVSPRTARSMRWAAPHTSWN